MPQTLLKCRKSMKPRPVFLKSPFKAHLVRHGNQIRSSQIKLLLPHKSTAIMKRAKSSLQKQEV